MSEAVQPAVRATGPGASVDRFAGSGGLLFVALLLIQNAVRASGPSFTATPSAVTSYFGEHRAAAIVPLALFPLGMVAILCFAAGIRSRAADSEGRWWADLGGLAVVVLAGLFGIVNIIEIVIAVDGTALIATPGLVRALWTLHSAAFGLNLAAIGVALAGLSRVARAARLIPRWLAVLALPGAGVLFVAAICTVAIAEGSHWLYLGYLGFAVWAIFLATAGTALLRSANR